MANRLIYEKIEAKGAFDAQEILRVANEKAKALEHEALANAQKEIDQLTKKTHERAEEKIKNRVTEAEQQAKQRTLYVKKEQIDLVFNHMLQAMKSFKKEELFAWVVKTINETNIEGSESIRVSKSDYPLYLDLFSSKKDGNVIVMDRLNQALGQQYHITLSKESVAIDGGFYLIGEKYDVDCSYKTILSALKEKEEKTVADLLFGDAS